MSTKTDPTTKTQKSVSDDEPTDDSESIPWFEMTVATVVPVLISLFICYRAAGNKMPGVLDIVLSILIAPLFIIYKLVTDWNAVIHGGVVKPAATSLVGL